MYLGSHKHRPFGWYRTPQFLRPQPTLGRFANRIKLSSDAPSARPGCGTQRLERNFLHSNIWTIELAVLSSRLMFSGFAGIRVQAWNCR